MGGLAASNLEVVDLLPEDAPRIQELSLRHYPEAFQQRLEAIAGNLDGHWDNTFGLGLERDGHLVGYLTAWVGDTSIQDRTESVMVIDDLVVEAGQRSLVFRLLSELAEAADEAGHRGIPVEAHLRVPLAQSLVTHARVLERLGYRIVDVHRRPDARLGEDLIWMRFETSLAAA